MTTRLVEDAATIVELVELRDIVVVELRAARLEGTILPVPAEEEPASNRVLRRVDEKSIEIRLIATVVNDGARFSVDVLVQYDKTEEFEPSDDALQEFTRRVGLMAGYPYVREAIADLSTRLRMGSVTLDILRPNEIDFGPPNMVDIEIANNKEVE